MHVRVYVCMYGVGISVSTRPLIRDSAVYGLSPARRVSITLCHGKCIMNIFYQLPTLLLYFSDSKEKTFFVVQCQKTSCPPEHMAIRMIELDKLGLVIQCWGQPS